MEILLSNQPAQAVDIFRSNYSNPQKFNTEIFFNHMSSNIRKFTILAKVSPKIRTASFRNKYLNSFVHFIQQTLSYLIVYDSQNIEIDNFDSRRVYLHKTKGTVFVYITEKHAHALRELRPHELDLTISYRENCPSDFCYRVSFSLNDVVHVEKKY